MAWMRQDPGNLHKQIQQLIQISGVPLDSGTRSGVLTEARKWIGTPWHHQGRINGVGVDCAMFLCEVYFRAGLLPFIDPRPYPADWHFHQDGERFLEWLGRYASEVGRRIKRTVAYERV